MKKYFYSHLVETESLLLAIHKMDLDESEKAHIVSLIDSSLHHTVLDAVLSELSEKDKKIFLEYVVKDEHDKVWKHLNEKVDGIEQKIKTAAEELTKQLHKDIEDSKEEK